MKRILMLSLLCLGMQVYSQTKPFPQNQNFAGCIKPSNVSQSTMNDQVYSYYTYWKGKYLKNNLSSLPGGYYVKGEITGSPDGYTPLGSSEGQGYGMLIAVLMAGKDPDAKTIYDGLFKTARAFKSSANANLMGWVVADAVSAQGHFGSATDGDLDIAYSLILAHYQWGSGGSINYLAEAQKMITNGIKASNVTTGNRLNLGDWQSKSTNDTRPSDWMLSHFRAYKQITNDVAWDNVLSQTYSMINRIQTTYSPSTGLLPDFATANPVQPAAANFLEGPNDGNYYYNASRVPLRVVLDFAHGGELQAKTAANKMITWAKSSTGGNPASFKAGYTLSGTNLSGNNYQAGVFIAPMVAAATCDAAHQAYLNSGWSSIVTMKTNYFDDTYNLLCQLYISGNWWKPENGGTQNQVPSITLTAPVAGSTFTAPASIIISANASDADGTISKVEFYNGSTKLGEDLSSPYSFSWSNVIAGSYSISARAIDNANASSNSSSVPISVSSLPPSQSPYGGIPWNIPGKIETENYDLGGTSIAFNEATAAINEGGQYRTDGVDIESCSDVGAGYNIGYVQAGEWLEYTVIISANGSYTFQVRVATTAADKSLRLELDGISIGTLNLPNTSGWQSWQTVSISGVPLTSGQKVLRLFAVTNDFNVNYIQVSASTSNQLPSISLTSPTSGSSYTAPANITISANANDADGSISKVEFYNDITKLGEDLTAPYSFSWNNVAAGSYSISARATDNSGATSSSATIVITVTTISTGCSTPNWTSSAVYLGGNRASRNGNVYEAKWWTQGQDPVLFSGTWDVWKLIGTCNARIGEDDFINETHRATIYPNPGTGAIQIEWPTEANPTAEVFIVDHVGKTHLVYSNISSGETILVNNLEAGVYVVYIKTKQNNYVQPFIKQ